MALRAARTLRSNLLAIAGFLLQAAPDSLDIVDGIRAQGFPLLIKPVSPPSLRVVMHNLLFEPELMTELP